ncbi:MAG: right-handed parallel beta-helix repeat-containing protein [Candidatus Cloacimonetes bacterium]|nr:right-handed parallel beta-helix repeat-containing protein [Candidatus Cloacimonadota bacterium]
MKNKSLIIILIITLILVTISCGEKTTEIESYNFGVILDSLRYSTIQEAIDEAVDGDTIFLTQGIFADAGDKNLNWDGNEKHLTIKLHQEADYAIIECNGKGNGFIFNCTHQNTSDVIDGITIRNCEKCDSENEIGYAGIYCEDVAVTIKNCIIKDCGWCGIYCDNADPIIENCEIFDNKDGIMADNESSPLIKLNIIRENELDGVFVSGDSYPSIINNLIVHNKRGIYCLYGRAWMVNNTIADNEVWGINYINSDSSEVINCIIWDNGKGFQTADINIVVSYSCAQDSFASVNPDTLGNIYDDPLFVFPGTNYHLPSISPCINEGDNDAVYWDVDLDDEQRINNEVVDMGVYEW